MEAKTPGFVPVCPLLRNLYGHPLAGLLWEKGSQEKILKVGFEKVPQWESLYIHRKEKLILGVYIVPVGLVILTVYLTNFN